MFCPKCKNNISDEAVSCEHCGTRIKIKCPSCGFLNVIGTKKCSSCGFELLKVCPVCRAANNPRALECRKCKTRFQEATSKEQVINETKQSIEKISKTINKSDPKLPDSVINRLANNVKTSTVIEDNEKQDTEITEIKNEEIGTVEVKVDENISQNDISSTGEIELGNIENFEHTEDKQNEIEQEISSESALSDDIIISDELVLEEDILEEKEADKYYSYGRQIVQVELVEALKSQQNCVIGLSAPDGVGKTHLLKNGIFSQLASPERIWVWAECTPLTQVTPMGAIQDALINFFSVSVLCANIDGFKKDCKKFFSKHFPEFKQNEIELLVNFLYPHKNSYYENILINRERTFELLERLFNIMKQNGNVVFIIDDFDMIDGSSYDFILRLISNGVVDSSFKLLLTYKDARDVDGFISSSILPQNAFISLYLGQMNNEEIDTMVKEFFAGNNPLPLFIKEQIYNNAKGNPAYVEGIITYLSEIKALISKDNQIVFNDDYSDLILPFTLTEIVHSKLNAFKQTNKNVYKLIIYAAILGNKFSLDVLNFASELEPDDFDESLKILIHFGYFAMQNNTTLIFKNTLIWKECYNYAKNDENYIQYNQNLYDTIAFSILTNNSLKALLVQNLGATENCMRFWTENTKLAAYIGDIGLYVISQKQCLKFLDKYSETQSTYIKNNIYERIGKLLAQTAPSQAIEFLSNAILVAQNEGNVLKVIDLATYLGISAQISGNYLGIIEIVDLVVKNIDKNVEPVGWALAKQKKLNAVCMLGNMEELISIAENDILPILKDYVTKVKKHSYLEFDVIYSGWFEANMTLAGAYILQGSGKGISLLTEMSELLKINKIESRYSLTRINIDLALGYTIQGFIKKSQKILKETSQTYQSAPMEPELRSKWNFVNILNKFFLNEYAAMKEELFDVVTYANNVGDNFTKNILKTLLGKIIKESGNVTKAMEIYNEQVTLFAGEKIATGALLSWYLIIDATMITDGPEKALEIAEKALDVAKNPKINNYYFMILYKMQIAEIYAIKGDLDAVKMYVEKALILAKKYNLNYQRVKLYLMYGKYFEERLIKSSEKSDILMNNIMKNYQIAQSIAKKLQITTLVKEADSSISNFEAFCKLNKLSGT